MQGLRDQLTAIHNYRVAQIADPRKYQSQVNRLVSALNRLLRRGSRNLLTPQEQALLDKQQHDTFTELSPVEQKRLTTEIDIMWNQIPSHLQDKAQKLAGLK